SALNGFSGSLMPIATLNRAARSLARGTPGAFVLDLDYDAFVALGGEAAGLAYRNLFSQHADLPRPLRRWAETEGIALRRLSLQSRERGGRSEKLLFGLEDGYAVETVLIRRRNGFTACV